MTTVTDATTGGTARRAGTPVPSGGGSKSVRRVRRVVVRKPVSSGASGGGSKPVSSGGASPGGRSGSGSGSEPGLGARLEAAVGVLESVVAELDPSRLTGADATELYGSLVGLERLTNAGKTLLAPRIEASGIWRERGHRNAPVMLAALEGIGVGQAQHTLVNGQRLEQLPGHRGRPAHGDAVGAQGHRADRGRGPRPRAGDGPARGGGRGAPPGRAGAVPAVPGHLGAGRPLGPGQAHPGGPALLVVDRPRGGLLLPGPGHPGPGGPDPRPPRPGGHPSAAGLPVRR